MKYHHSCSSHLVCILLRTIVLFASRLVILESASSAARSRAMVLCRYLSITPSCGGIDHNVTAIPRFRKVSFRLERRFGIDAAFTEMHRWPVR